MTDDPLIGRQLANFRIERAIGRGGMAYVYYGQDVKLERPVAIKVIDARYRDNPAYAERFVREARAVATWRHENIIQIYYADEQDGLYYFVMEYIDGLDLGELMSQYAAEGELMPHAEVLRIGRAVASALDYAHQQGVIHRDVKPSNVLVTGDGRVVLTDFGLAMDIQQGSLGEVFGSSLYIAPEQARSSADAVPQSDLYSLGVILYEMLVSVVPFDDPSPTTVALQHLTQPPPPPREINPNLGEETEAVLLKALSKSPDERYQTGGELIAALERALQASQLAPVEGGELPPLPAGVQPPAVRSLSRMSVDEKVALHLQASAKPAPPRDFPPRTDASLLGQQLDEYRLDDLLGQGGMARVYRGLDVRLKRRVAIKVIGTPFRTDSDYLMRFEREAQAIAKLEHPHIVRLYRYGEANGLLYMAMQYIEGADLGSVLANYQEDQEFIEPEEASRIVREVCLALDYAHDQGVIHRDVKPSNIILDRQGRAILTDFGLALLTELGTRGEIFGSPHYIAPEQAISSAKVVPQSDLYAVGVILYEMFTGALPFDAGDPLDIAMLQMTEPPRPPREWRPDISPELEAVILKALAKEPEERYQSGADLADALDQALRITPVEAPSSSRATASRLSIPERVAKSAEHSLPPIPAAVATPAPQRVKPETAPTPTTPIVSTTSPASKRLIVYAGVGVGICMFLTMLLAAVLLMVSGSAKEIAERAIATETPLSVVESEVTATETADSGVATTDIQPETPALAFTAAMTATTTMEPTLTPSQVPPTTAPLTLTPAPSPTGTPPATSTDTATPASTPTSTEMPTATSAPTETFTPMATPTTEPPTPVGPASYELLIAKRDGDSLFVVNQTTEAFPLALLRLGDDKGAINGTEWGIEMLESGACVTAWKDKGKPRPPDGLTCNQVGAHLTRGGGDLFWKEAFDVYYDGQPIDACEEDQKECSVSIPTQASYSLLIAKRGEDGLFVVNRTTEAFPLAPLRLGDDNSAINGTEWGIEMLGSGACVVAWKDEGDPKPPDGLTCNEVGKRLTCDEPDCFWKSTFNVYYSEELIDTCEKRQEKCSINIPIDAIVVNKTDLLPYLDFDLTAFR